MAALDTADETFRQRDMTETAGQADGGDGGMDVTEQVRVLIHYMVNAGEGSAPEFMRALATRLPQHEERMMTIAQQLEQKGLEKGVQLGREEGRTEGGREATLTIARTCWRTALTGKRS